MAIQVQIREAVLASACIEFVQEQLFSTCAPDISPSLHVDHVDTVPGSVAFEGTQGTITVTLDIVVYVVTELDIEAHANAVPDGALTPVGKIGISLALAIVGTALEIVSVTSDPSTLTPPPLQAAVKAILDAALAALDGTILFDTAPVVSALSSLVPANPDLARGGGVFAVRFGASGPAVPRLSPGQDWGAVLDAAEATGLLSSRIPAGLPIDVSWLPDGPTPGIGANIKIDLSVLGSAAASAVAIITFVAPASLKIGASWDLDFKGIATFLEPEARKLAREFLRDQIANKIPGVVNDGPQSFTYAIALPAIPPFLHVQLVWTGITSDENGMTIGGRALAPFRGPREILSATPSRFGKPTWFGHCRDRARSGDGSPPSNIDPNTLMVRGGTTLSNAGTLCGIMIQPPNQWLSPPFINQTASGVGFTLPTDVAGHVTSDVKVVVRTARGTRFFDFGGPVLTRDENGEIEITVSWLDDCYHFSGIWLKLVTGQAVTIDDFVPVPLEHPDWIAVLGADIGLNSHLITIAGLDPGEIVTFLGGGLSLELSAGTDGVAVVPAFVGTGSSMRDAQVQRLSRRLFDGRIEIQTVEFTRLAVIGATDAAVVQDIDGIARVAWQEGDTVRVADYRPGPDGPFTAVLDQSDTSLNPQPLPPGPPDSSRLAQVAGLGSNAVAFALAGIDQRRMAVADVGGGQAVLIANEDGRARVVGSYAGPLVGMQEDGGFAIAKSGGVLHLFSVNRPEPTVFEP